MPLRLPAAESPRERPRRYIGRAAHDGDSLNVAIGECALPDNLAPTDRHLCVPRNRHPTPQRSMWEGSMSIIIMINIDRMVKI